MEVACLQVEGKESEIQDAGGSRAARRGEAHGPVGVNDGPVGFVVEYVAVDVVYTGSHTVKERRQVVQYTTANVLNSCFMPPTEMLSNEWLKSVDEN